MLARPPAPRPTPALLGHFGRGQTAQSDHSLVPCAAVQRCVLRTKRPERPGDEGVVEPIVDVPEAPCYVSDGYGAWPQGLFPPSHYVAMMVIELGDAVRKCCTHIEARGGGVPCVREGSGRRRCPAQLSRALIRSLDHRSCRKTFIAGRPTEQCTGWRMRCHSLSRWTSSASSQVGGGTEVAALPEACTPAHALGPHSPCCPVAERGQVLLDAMDATWDASCASCGYRVRRGRVDDWGYFWVGGLGDPGLTVSPTPLSQLELHKKLVSLTPAGPSQWLVNRASCLLRVRAVACPAGRPARGGRTAPAQRGTLSVAGHMGDGTAAPE